MRILFLTPGTGSFYCGTCMRDNALAVALRKRGHDALMVPLYLPPTLDEPSAAENAPLFYGGINVYLQQISGVFRKTPRWVDKLFDSPTALSAAARRAGMTQASDLGALTLSMLRGEDGRQVKELERLVEWLQSDGKAEVICLSNALLIGLARQIKTQTGATIACTLQGEDSFLDSLPEPDRAASWATLAERARDVDAFIAVSRYHADLMGRRARIPAERLHVVYNGIDLTGYPEPDSVAAASVRRETQPPTVGYLSRMCPPKGLHLLVDAWVLLKKRGAIPHLKLRVAGAQTAGDIAYIEEQKAKLQAIGAIHDAEFLPNIDKADKIAFLKSLSVLSVPALYGESFGLYLLEALAAGVPVVEPAHAAFPEVLEQTGGGVLFGPPFDANRLADALESLLLDPTKTGQLGAEGQQNIYAAFSVQAMAERVEAIFSGAPIPAK